MPEAWFSATVFYHLALGFWLLAFGFLKLMYYFRIYSNKSLDFITSQALLDPLNVRGYRTCLVNILSDSSHCHMLSTSQ